MVTRNKETIEALGDVMKLIDEGLLVRDIKEDGNFAVFMRQSIRIVRVLKRAQDIVERGKEV